MGCWDTGFRPGSSAGSPSDWGAWPIDTAAWLPRNRTAWGERSERPHPWGRAGWDQWEWAPGSGRGQVYSWTITHRPIDPGFADELPYAVLVVEMDEGPRLIGNLRDLAPAELVLGTPVEVVFEKVSDTVALTHFRPVA